MPLAQALLAPRALGEHHDDVPLAAEPDGGLDRLQVALAAAHGKGAARRDERPEREPEQLGLGHEAEVPAREERHPERPGVGVREMVRREDVSTLRRKPFEALPALPEDEPQHGVAERADDEIRPARTRIFGHRPFQYRPFRTLAVSRSLAMVTRAPGRRPGRILSSDPKRAPVAERRLVIVESPAKAKTIAGYLGDGYVVESSIGHIRDLPEPRRRHSGRGEEGAVGPPRRQRR